MKCNDNVSMKYRCYVRWTHSGREYLSEFTTETANPEVAHTGYYQVL